MRERVISVEPEAFEAFFQQSIVPQVIARLDGTFAYVNPAFERLMGRPRAELVDHPFLEMVHPDDRASTERELAGLAEGRPTLEFDNRYMTADGPRLLRWTAVPAPGELIFATVVDVTEQVARYRSIEQYTRQLQMAHVGTWQVDLVLSRIHWSPEVKRIHGVAPDFEPDLERAIGFIHPEDRPVVQRLMSKAIEERGSFSFRLRLLRPSGEERIVKSVGRVEVDPSGQPSSVFGVFADVTEDERIQGTLAEQARRAQAQASRLESLQQLAMMQDFESIEEATGAYLESARSKTGMPTVCVCMDGEGLRPVFGTAAAPVPTLVSMVMRHGR